MVESDHRAAFGHRFGFWYDDAYLHYAFNNGATGEDIVYRRGSPQADGSVQWGAEHVAFDMPEGLSALYPNVTVTASGEPWVSFLYFSGGLMAPPEQGVVVRSTARNGTWQTAPSFPFVIADDSETDPGPLGIPLPDGSIVWIYNQEGEGYLARSWANDTWGAAETVTSAQDEFSLFAGIASGSEVHATYGGGAVQHRVRSASGLWGPAQLASAALSVSGNTGMSLSAPGRVVVTLLSNATIQTREWRSGAWLAPTTVLENQELLHRGCSLKSTDPKI